MTVLLPQCRQCGKVIIPGAQRSQTGLPTFCGTECADRWLDGELAGLGLPVPRTNPRKDSDRSRAATRASTAVLVLSLAGLLMLTVWWLFYA